jgi:diacylglycerol kinase (ATP)
MQKVLFIVNPTSKTVKINETKNIIKEMADRFNFTWKTYYTEAHDTKTDIRQQIKSANPNLVIVVGGDGTINLVASELINSPVELGIIPAGSANGLAYNLDMPAMFQASLEKILCSDAKPFDVIRFNGKFHCLHLSDVGINARTVKRFEQEDSHGLSGYARHMLKELFSKSSSFSFQLSVGGKTKKYKAEMLVVANAKTYGTGAVINPIGITDDGKFEVIIIKPYPWWAVVHLIWMFLKGTHHRLKWVKVISTEKAEIKFFKPQVFQSDGEIVDGIKNVTAMIVPSAVKIRY